MKTLRCLLLATFALALGTATAVAGSASLVLDARTGKVLSSENADVLNHPASLTKMMTVYMAFEALKSGKLSWDSKIKVSKAAAAKPPMRLGLKSGMTITVREAVLGMIVRSGNDAAAAMAEKLGGSEANFARMMTAKARQLGMSKTIFINASGLPASKQVTTAREMSTLAVALMRDFPREYRLFATESFNFRGRKVRGHNNLMYRYDGMDGIKTGYTNASGFNLVSAVKDGNRRVVGVVLGGKTARSRDAKMAALLDRHVGKAAKGGRQLVASTRGGKTVEAPVEVAAVATSEVPMPYAAPQRAKQDSVAALIAATSTTAIPAERPTEVAEIETTAAVPAASGGWQIQISAAPSAEAARMLLAQARSEAGAPLAGATPYTEAVGKGAKAIYRARFVGFSSKDAAAAACDALKQRSYDCMMLPSRG
ncbi:D-alanyl-D-alanine carboxypeptidase [Ensifer sp. PDNC004]|uniref:D-alanyl-D-alanine carboxypeptidase family protein n=1 Tax=unclassified Ensifer TaxID=2633371 RepID=UPI0009DD0860|nr:MULTISPECIES: D-alanyl-D-alanine carboxypeptidase family protein [unclassified Ensifer]MBD9648861.1 D-alanyl-D-alanine carboxypeptidase [Ensifer sp. ENS09]QRY70018.1 D-alanyl-D-alanine carboxypeptidase [Ensifer sp. PDNC004]